MVYLAVSLILAAVVCFIWSFFWNRGRVGLWIIGLVSILNSFFAAPLNWMSFVQGTGFRISPIETTGAPVELQKLALPTDTPEQILLKMGCYVCHRIPRIPQSRQSHFGPLLIPGSTAAQWIGTEEYRERVRSGKAAAKTPREYIVESILQPDAFIVPGFSETNNPERSLMYQSYSQRFTRPALEKLADYLLTLDAHAAIQDGLVMGHGTVSGEPAPGD
jgi:hypothetical protein